MGIRTALARSLREMLEYIGDVPDDEDDEEDPTAALVLTIKKELEATENMEIGE